MDFSAFRQTLVIVLASVMAIAAALLPCPAQAQAGLAGLPINVCLKRVVPGEVASTLFKQQARFDCDVRQTRLGKGDYWAKASALPTGARLHEAVAIRQSALWQQSQTIFGRYADDAIVSTTIDRSNISRHLQLGAILEQRLPARNAPLLDVMWQLRGSENVRGILVGTRIATIAESNRANLIIAAIYAAFAGLCVALLVHNLAMWSAMRHGFQIAYCVMLSTLMIYALSSSGALAWLWPGMPDADRLKINYLALAVSASAALAFARTYFEPRVFSRSLEWASIAISIGLLGSATVFALFVPWQFKWLHYIYSCSFLAMLGIIPPVLWRAWRQDSKYLWVFAVAWAGPIVFAGVRTANSLNLISWSFWVDNSTILAMTAEALMSSLAITYRVRLLSIERDDARVQELAARALADLDPLTGLLNRRSFLARAIGRTGEQLLCIADLDHFKIVNETIGHDGGDEVLRVFARALRKVVPADSLVARIGGEEFAVVIAADRGLDPNRILERLRAERMPFDLTVTASIGASTGPLASEIHWKKLYRSADRALFAAKAAGRDRARHDTALAA